MVIISVLKSIKFNNLEANVDEIHLERGSQEENGSKSQCDRQRAGENNNANDQIFKESDISKSNDAVDINNLSQRQEGKGETSLVKLTAKFSTISQHF